MEQSLSLRSVADYLGISENYLSSVFKSDLKENFSSYVERVRVCQAVHEIEKGTMTLNDIAQAVGYTNDQTLRRAVKRVTGKTPTEIRKGILEEE